MARADGNHPAAAEMMGDDGLGLEELRALRFPILALYGENSHARLTGEALLECGRRRSSAACAAPGISSRPRARRK